MNDWTELNDERLKFGRYLSKISAVTRVIGFVACVGSVITILSALGMRNSGDQIGFTLCGLAVLLFGILVWATGVFHGAIARILPTIVQMDRRLDWLTHKLDQRALPAPAESSSAPVEAPPAAAPLQTVAAPWDEASAPVEAAPAEQVAPAEPEPPPAPRPEPPPDIVKTPCPHCGGLTHPQATRCVHCMKKIAR